MQTNFQLTHRNIIECAVSLVAFVIAMLTVIYLMPIIGDAAIERVLQAGQQEQYNPYLDPALYSALEIAGHKADPDYDNPHYYGRVVPLGNVITVQVINGDGERELIETTFDYLRNGSKG